MGRVPSETGMPKREDERLLNLAGRHPAACTCQDCTDRFLKGRKIKPQRNRWAGVGRGGGEEAAAHPRGCTCVSCGLLRTLDNLPRPDRQKGGFLKRLFRKK